MALPAGMEACRVDLHLTEALVDSPTDPDRDPDTIPIAGAKVVFRASLNPSVVRIPSADPPTVVSLAPITVHTNANGDMVSPDGQLGVYLIPSTDERLDPHGWTWSVTITKPEIGLSISTQFVTTPGGHVNLGDVVPVPPNPGTALLQWEAVVADTQAARDEALAAKGAAEEAVAAAEGIAAGINPTEAPTPSTVPERTSTGALKVGAPIASEDAARFLDVDLLGGSASRTAARNGTTDDRAAIQAALDAADRLFTLRAGTYRLEGTLTIPGNRTLTLRGEGMDATVLDCYGGTPWLNTLQGASASTTLTAALAVGDRTITVASAAGIAVEQLVILTSTQTMPETTYSLFRSHAAIVSRISGTTITLDRPVPIDFSVSGFTPTVRTYTVGHIAIRDLTVVCGDTDMLYFTEVQRTAGIKFENVRFTTRVKAYQGTVGAGVGISAVRVQEAVDSDFIGCEFDYMHYGVMPTRASHGTTLRGCRARRSRHIGAPTGGAQGFRAVDCTTFDCYAGYDSHQGAFDSTLSGCRDYSPEIASKFRGRSDIIRDCSFYGSQGIELTNDPGLDAAPDKSGLVKLVDGCRVEGPVTGTAWGKTIRNSYIRGHIGSHRPSLGGALVLDGVEIDLRGLAAPLNGAIWLGYHAQHRFTGVTFMGPLYGLDQSAGTVAATPVRAFYVGALPAAALSSVVMRDVTIDGFDHAIHTIVGGDYTAYRIEDLTVRNTVVAVSHLGNNKTGGPIWDRVTLAGVATADIDPIRWRQVPVGSGASSGFTRTRRLMFGTAAPTLGTWEAGDTVENITPVVGSPKGWKCTVAGTPGTWVSTGNL